MCLCLASPGVFLTPTLSWSVNLAQCRHVTLGSDQQQNIVSMEDVFFVLVQIFLSLSIVAGTLDSINLKMWIIKSFSQQKTFHRMLIGSTPKNNKATKFKCLISIPWYSTASCIYTSFSILQLSGFKCFYARCNLRLPTAYVYSPGIAVSSVTVDMIAICCHEHAQTWLIMFMTF